MSKKRTVTVYLAVDAAGNVSTEAVKGSRAPKRDHDLAICYATDEVTTGPVKVYRVDVPVLLPEPVKVTADVEEIDDE